ncbi:MAG: hypothetical protein R3266_09625 [Gemmatimonadota bacterium]|nr:hypothetical protein [Gemmatimonadota bacterium]
MIDKRTGPTAADRLPEAPWRRVWSTALAAAVLALGAWELSWRARGWVPTATDPAAWVMARGRLDSEGTALLGSSRMQADLDPEVWARETGERPTMLALFGSTPLPALEALAADTEFRGTVIVDFFPGQALNPREPEASIAAMIDAYDMAGHSPGRWLETRFSHLVNPAFVFRRPVLSARSLLEMAWDRAFPRAVFEWPSRGMRKDRFFPMEFPPSEGELPAPRDLDAFATRAWTDSTTRMYERVERATGRIQDRGGEVVFVHVPHCGVRRLREERIFPREIFWDEFASRIQAATIHFADYPSLARFDCPDGSHLDRDDTAAFTRALAEIVGEALEGR